MSSTFFTFLKKFFTNLQHQIIWIVLTFRSFEAALLSYHSVCGLSTAFFDFFNLFSVERRWRDLNPRAGCPTYTLSRGASSATWVHLLAWKFATKVFDFSLLQAHYRASAKSSLTKKSLSVNGFFIFFENNFVNCLYSRHNIKFIPYLVETTFRFSHTFLSFHLLTHKFYLAVTK